jgi:hypothetical protein
MMSSADFPPVMNSNTSTSIYAPMTASLFIEEKGGIKPNTQAVEQMLSVPIATARVMRSNRAQPDMVIC